jgi:hypothetical protein
MEDFKDPAHFLEAQRINTSNTKANSSGLWGEAEKSFLEDVTMNLIADDDALKNLKGTTAMKWDASKKRYMLKKVDRDGKVIAEKKNEAGVKITQKMRDKRAEKQESIYKKWQ